MTVVTSTNPATGVVVALDVEESTSSDVANACARAARVAHDVARHTLEWRAGLLEAMAHSLEEDSVSIIEVADDETALGETRLAGELRRTCFQFRFFADVVRDGGFLEASIDHPYDSPMGPLPDLRRQLEPLGPVAVFGASNFPLAFSVPGGDTASALAAGCPVVVKAHPAHPRTSLLTHSALQRACARHGAPEGTVQLVIGFDAGAALVEAPEISAVGFTGSYAAGMALLARAQSRVTPIPFYGELGSVNPLVVSRRAAWVRGQTLGEGIVASMTMGSGQFCTKPGLFFVPDGDDGDALVRAAASALENYPGATMLSAGIRDRFVEGVSRLSDTPGVRLVSRSSSASTFAGAGGSLVEVSSATFVGPDRSVFETECFGAVGVVVRYEDADLYEALESLDAALTFTCQLEPNDPMGPALLAVARRKAGRVIVNGYPTGVGVSWSMQHGGPLPAATSSLHTSVGATAVRRWLRPVSYQGVPDELLPDALKDTNPWAITRRVDGTLRAP